MMRPRLPSNRNVISSYFFYTSFSLSMENEQADAGRDDRTRLARPNSHAQTGTGKYDFSMFS